MLGETRYSPPEEVSTTSGRKARPLSKKRSMVKKRERIRNELELIYEIIVV
jgi:hypothetical protein